jgi:NADPH-dependent 2,4-dienoyl-CoA reductase/sulfur reductase-like enzyme
VGAALAGAEAGLDTLIVDEAPTSGGQVYRAMAPTMRLKRGADPGPDYRIGGMHRRLLAESRVRTAFGRRVWYVSPSLRVEAMGPNGAEQYQPRGLVIATGTTERVIPFPGWTLPGVIGLAATTILLKSQQMLPGERSVVAGCGPLLAAVAVAIIKGGGRVEAVVDLAGRSEWLAALPGLSSRPDLTLRGIDWVRRIRAAGIPILSRHGIRSVSEKAGRLEVEIGPVDAERRPRLGISSRIVTSDCLAIGHGLSPATEVTRLLRARHAFDPDRGGWIAVRDSDFRTSLERVYVAGDGAGISGAAPAYLQGRIAGLAAARDLGKLDAEGFRGRSQGWRRKLAWAERFGHAMARLMALRPGQVEAIAAETVICRCEDVTRREIEEAVANGAREVNQLKAWTRCGMGPCQGRMCGDTAATLVAAHVGSREGAGYFSARAPIRPIALADLVGDYDYDDIPLPKAAPL